MSDDLISRQAAIAYAISGLTREIDGENWIRVSEVRESIKALSSPQPEIIRCKDCKIRYTDRCGMFDVEAEWEWTEDNGFCQYGERKESCTQEQ